MLLFVTQVQPAGSPGRPELQTLELQAGGRLEFLLLEPRDFDAERAHPVLLALPPGDQSLEMVAAGLELYWRSEAHARGWIVVSPAAPRGELFADGDGSALIELLDHVAAKVHVAGGRVHVAGPSNGGRSAFRFALQHPERTASLTVLPGFPPAGPEPVRLEPLLDIPIAMFVGGEDERWLAESRTCLAALTELGARSISLVEFPGEGHQPASVTGALLFDRLDRFHALRMLEVAECSAVADVLDDFHDAAAKADAGRYFDHFAPGAIFLGTDATERWTIPEMRAYAMPHFEAGRGWTYTATERFVGIDAHGTTAWFDERLQHDSYGELRGSGALRKYGSTWRIAQYNLALPVPNDLMRTFVERIRGR